MFGEALEEAKNGAPDGKSLGQCMEHFDSSSLIRAKHGVEENFF